MRTRSEIIEEVGQLTEQVLDNAPEMTEAEAEAFVWEESGLYDEYTAAPPELPSEPVMKADPEPTVAEVIMKVVEDQAALAAWTQWPGKSLGDLELDIWSSPEGSSLYELYRGPEGKLPYTQARQQVRKHADGPWAILDRWLSE